MVITYDSDIFYAFALFRVYQVEGRKAKQSRSECRETNHCNHNPRPEDSFPTVSPLQSARFCDTRAIFDDESKQAPMNSKHYRPYHRGTRVKRRMNALSIA